MSAFLVSKKHIDALVFARTKDPMRSMKQNRPSDTELGRMLWRENMLSLGARYNEPADEAALAAYEYDVANARGLPVLTLIKAVHCYEYQACEHDGWDASAARAYCDDVEPMLVRALPGYDAAPWGIDDDEAEDAEDAEPGSP